MDNFLDENYVDSESITSYENSDIILTILFAILDLIVIIISLLTLKSKSRNIVKLKSKLMKLFVIDIIIRILYTRRYNQWNVYQEILITILNTSQFYLIISFLDEILYTPTTSKLKKSNDKYKRVKFCIIFFIFTFSYDKIAFSDEITYYLYFKINKLIYLLQCFIILYFLYALYKELKIKIFEIVNNIISESQRKYIICRFVIGSPQSCLTLFMIYYILAILFLFIRRHVFLIYANILLNIIKNSSKVFVFFICEAIIYILNKIKVEKEKERAKQNKSYMDEIDIIKI